MSNQTLFIYHQGCFDGHTAAWIYSRYVDADAEFLPAKYGDPPPDVRGRDVIIADFSYKRHVMKGIIATARSTQVYDHHVTAREALDGIDEELAHMDIGPAQRIVFDMERSGAGIVWDELVDKGVRAGHQCDDGVSSTFNRRPLLVDYVEDRDLWRLALPHAREYMANVYAAPMTFEAWDALKSRPIGLMIERGAAILEYMQEYGTKALAEALPQRWDLRGEAIPPEPVWCVNLPYMNCSDYLTRLLADKNMFGDAPFVAGYFRRADGRWQFSLRSRPDFDCSAVAKVFGGGGHRQAAGFDVAELSEVFAS